MLFCLLFPFAPAPAPSKYAVSSGAHVGNTRPASSILACVNGPNLFGPFRTTSCRSRNYGKDVIAQCSRESYRANGCRKVRISRNRDHHVGKGLVIFSHDVSSAAFITASSFPGEARQCQLMRGRADEQCCKVSSCRSPLPVHNYFVLI